MEAYGNGGVSIDLSRFFVRKLVDLTKINAKLYFTLRITRRGFMVVYLKNEF